ncbi:hypothetical protein ACOSQ2_031428 [Xanthoceras sorbifolium]
MSSFPWLCDGDFNEILHLGEKDGGVERPRYLMTNFRNTLNDCMLQDLGFAAPRFTWCNGRKNQDFVQERLDRFVSSLDWQQLFPFLVVSHLDSWGSNHRPILVDFRGSGNNCVDESKGGGRFHFKEIWTDYPECGEIVSSSWSGGRVSGSLADVASKISVCVLSPYSGGSLILLRRSAVVYRLSGRSCTISIEWWIRLIRGKLIELRGILMCCCIRKNDIGDNVVGFLGFVVEIVIRGFSTIKLLAGSVVIAFMGCWLLDSEDIWRTEHGHMAGLIQNYVQQIFTSSNPYAGDFNNVLLP